jgi:hypothetical protein
LLIAGLPERSAIVGVSPGEFGFNESSFGSESTDTPAHPELFTIRFPTESPLAVLVITAPEPSVMHSAKLLVPILLLAMIVFSRMKMVVLPSL